MQLRSFTFNVSVTDEELKARMAKSVDMVVTTLKLSGFVDQRCQLQLPGTATVRQLKDKLAQNFPGKPPVPVQRVFSGLTLLSDDMQLYEIAQSAPGRVQLVLDMPPPIDPEAFDPATAVPSNRDSQLEAYCANMAALTQLQSGARRALAGDKSPFSSPLAPSDMTCALEMQSHMSAVQGFLQGSYAPKEGDGGVRDGELPLPPLPPAGPLHEVLRPVAMQLDVDWKNSLMMAFFVALCAKFGAFSPTLRAMRLLGIALIFVAKLRPVKYGIKVAYNKLRDLPFITDIIVALLPAPDQVLLQFDEKAYVQKLYGDAGPKFRPEFEQFLAENTKPKDDLIVDDDNADASSSDE
ncbi:hypothetical protein JKP88DRAFT_270694 [Tribonema minus]|uniref:Ubiquitin-like domain-containing protein n=1 Tax=Tribonema minus TaxID=303371 RepID=A0A836CA69_9STRA|nr:hypothetical protein JKP88DRAFT_270694 [Tribonema minus]